MKACTKCRELKPVSEFYEDKRAGRLMSICKACTLARSAAYRAANRQRIRAQGAAYRASDAERERARDAAREWYAKNREAALWYRKVQKYRTRAERYGFEPVIESFTRADVLARWGDGCHYCETGAFEHLDHYVPVIEGGTHTLENVRPSCGACNIKRENDARVARRVAS